MYLFQNQILNMKLEFSLDVAKTCHITFVTLLRYIKKDENTVCPMVNVINNLV